MSEDTYQNLSASESDAPAPGGEAAYQEPVSTDQDDPSVQTPEPSEPAAEQEPEQIDVEAEARKLGWNPNYKPSKPWHKKRSAEEFLQFFDEQKESRALKKELEDTKKTLEETRKEVQSSKDFALKSVQQIEQEAKKKSLAQIDVAIRRAVDDGDVQTWERLTKRKDQLEKQESKFKPPAPKPEPESRQESPEMRAFLEKNNWYNTDSDLTSEANEIGQAIVNSRGLRGKTLLDEVARRIRLMHPERFKNERQSSAVQDGDSTARPTGSSSAKGYAGLPHEAKIACDRFVAEGVSDRTYKNRQDAQKHFIQLYNS